MATEINPETKNVSVPVTVSADAPTKFGFGQIGKATPEWSKWAFRIFFYVTSIVTLGLDIFTEIPVETKYTITKAVTFANLAVHMLSKMVGIDVSGYETQVPYTPPKP